MVTLHIDSPEFERIGNVNFAAYDDGPVAQILDAGNEPQKFRLVTQALPPAFRLKLYPGPEFTADLK